MTLELLNLELELLEPWAAAGSFVAPAEASVHEVAGTVLRTEHSRLLLPLWSGPGAQFVPSQSAANALSLVAPGVPEASDVYELTPHGVQSLRHLRVAGGVRVTLPEFGLTAQVLLAHDPLIIDAVNRRAARIGRRAAELQRNLAVHKLITVQAIAGRLAPRTPIRASAAWFDSAQKSLQQCDAQLASGDAAGAALSAQRAARPLRLIERAYWDAAVHGLASPVTSPAAVSFDTLPSHWRLMDRLRASAVWARTVWTPAILRTSARCCRPAGDMIFTPRRRCRPRSISPPQAAHSGRFGLRLAVAPLDPKNPPAVIETPADPVHQPGSASRGRAARLHPRLGASARAITGSTDGLLIVDSLAGECLADRIGQTKGWRQFALYRVAPRSGPMCVTFALSGMGEAWLDDVEIQVIADR